MTEKYAARFSQPVQPGMVLTGLWFYSLDLLEILEPRANTVYALNRPVSWSKSMSETSRTLLCQRFRYQYSGGVSMQAIRGRREIESDRSCMWKFHNKGYRCLILVPFTSVTVARHICQHKVMCSHKQRTSSNSLNWVCDGWTSDLSWPWSQVGFVVPVYSRYTVYQRYSQTFPEVWVCGHFLDTPVKWPSEMAGYRLRNYRRSHKSNQLFHWKKPWGTHHSWY